VDGIYSLDAYSSSHLEVETTIESGWLLI